MPLCRFSHDMAPLVPQLFYCLLYAMDTNVPDVSVGLVKSTVASASGEGLI